MDMRGFGLCVSVCRPAHTACIECSFGVGRLTHAIVHVRADMAKSDSNPCKRRPEQGLWLAARMEALSYTFAAANCQVLAKPRLVRQKTQTPPLWGGHGHEGRAGLSDKMLIEQLKTLAAHGIVLRTDSHEVRAGPTTR